jgi:hypothetical protein
MIVDNNGVCKSTLLTIIYNIIVKGSDNKSRHDLYLIKI